MHSRNIKAVFYACLAYGVDDFVVLSHGNDHTPRAAHNDWRLWELHYYVHSTRNIDNSTTGEEIRHLVCETFTEMFEACVGDFSSVPITIHHCQDGNILFYDYCPATDSDAISITDEECETRWFAFRKYRSGGRDRLELVFSARHLQDRLRGWIHPRPGAGVIRVAFEEIEEEERADDETDSESD
jgi:hypothetical protein